MTSAEMKKALSIVSAALALAGSAAAEPQAPPPLWTGFYIGLNAGYTWGESQNSSISTLPIVNPVLVGTGALTIAEIVSGSAALGSTGVLPTRSGGFIGGGQVGYNRRIGDFVAGVEADIQGVAGGAGSGSDWRASPLPPTPLVWLTNIAARKTVDYLGTLRGRLGWLVTPTLLAYGSGGLAYGGSAANFSVFQKIPGADPPDPPALIGASAFANTRAGWTGGGASNGCCGQTGASKPNIFITTSAGRGFTPPCPLSRQTPIAASPSSMRPRRARVLTAISSAPA